MCVFLSSVLIKIEWSCHELPAHNNLCSKVIPTNRNTWIANIPVMFMLLFCLQSKTFYNHLLLLFRYYFDYVAAAIFLSFSFYFSFNDQMLFILASWKYICAVAVDFSQFFVLIKSMIFIVWHSLHFYQIWNEERNEIFFF